MILRSNTSPKPRRARFTIFDYRLMFAVAAMLIIVALIAFGMRQAKVKGTTGPQPAPTATWTTYVPQTSKVCHDLAEAARKMSDQAVLYGESSWKAVEQLRTAKTLADVSAARKENEKAKRAAKGLDRSQPALNELAKKCEDA